MRDRLITAALAFLPLMMCLTGSIAATLSVDACAPPSPTTKQIIAQCALDGDKLHARDPDRYSTLSQYVEICMAARGYDWNLGADCGPTAGFDLALLRPECYRRSRAGK